MFSAATSRAGHPSAAARPINGWTSGAYAQPSPFARRSRRGEAALRDRPDTAGEDTRRFVEAHECPVEAACDPDGVLRHRGARIASCLRAGPCGRDRPMTSARVSTRPSAAGRRDLPRRGRRRRGCRRVRIPVGGELRRQQRLARTAPLKRRRLSAADRLPPRARLDSNQGPRNYEFPALTAELRARSGPVKRTG